MGRSGKTKTFIRGNLDPTETKRCSEELVSKVVVFMYIQAQLLVILFPQQADENSTLPLEKAWNCKQFYLREQGYINTLKN